MLMSVGSDRVKKWRRQSKERVVAAMGGKCIICGYNRCNDALALHHVNPGDKEFSFNSIRANPKSWETIVGELKKCVLVCHNCHQEIHAGLVTIPKDAPTFNEEYTNYKEFRSNFVGRGYYHT
jgi:hypothetical protein